MPDLQHALAQVKERVAKYRGTAINEQNTKAALVEPIVRALGWDLEDLEEVHREFRPKSADNPVDYALLVLRTPRLFIEAKALGENLDDRKWASQIMGYAVVAGVAWVVLTNGNEYRLYNAHAPVPVEEKIFRTVRITDDYGTVEQTLHLLSKERMQQNELEALWNAHFVDRQIRPAIEALFFPVPDPALIKLLAKRISTLSAGEIKAGIGRLRLILDFPAAPTPPQKPLQRSLPHQQAERFLLPTDPAGGPATTAPAGVDATLANLIRAGLIHPPLPLETPFKGRRLTARIEADGSVLFNDVPYQSLSVSAGYARNSVSGPPPDGRKYWQTNGWTFWQFRDADGRLKRIDVLRQRYSEGETIRAES